MTSGQETLRESRERQIRTGNKALSKTEADRRTQKWPHA